MPTRSYTVAVQLTHTYVLYLYTYTLRLLAFLLSPLPTLPSTSTPLYSLLALYNGDGTLYTPRKPNRFAAYVKENFSSVRKAYPGTPHKEVMKILSANFSAPKDM